jgi:hypothetical protein
VDELDALVIKSGRSMAHAFATRLPSLVNFPYCCHVLTFLYPNIVLKPKTNNKLHGLSPRANYTHRATAACRRSDCQLLRIEDATWSA